MRYYDFWDVAPILLVLGPACVAIGLLNRRFWLVVAGGLLTLPYCLYLSLGLSVQGPAMLILPFGAAVSMDTRLGWVSWVLAIAYAALCARWLLIILSNMGWL